METTTGTLRFLRPSYWLRLFASKEHHSRSSSSRMKSTIFSSRGTGLKRIGPRRSFSAKSSESAYRNEKTRRPKPTPTRLSYAWLSQYGATNPSHRRGLRCEELNPAAQSRIRKELVACLRYGLLVWMSTQARLPSQ